MKQRHRNELFQHLDRVMDEGSSTFTRQALKRWFSAERITVGVWRDIQDMWSELVDDIEVETLFVGNDGDIYTLIWGKGLDAAEDAWFKPISKIINKTSDNK